MMTFFDGGKHVLLATAATDCLLARKRTTKIAEIVQTNHEGSHGTRNRQTTTALTTTAHTRLANMVLSHPRQPPQLPCLLRGSVSGQATIRAKTPTRANQVPFALATHRATAVRHTRPVRRRHCRGHFLCFHKMLEYLSFALHVARNKLFLSKAHGPLRGLMTTFTAEHRRWGPALTACPPPDRVYFLRRRCALTATAPSIIVRDR